MRKPNLNNFGKGLKFNQRASKQKQLSEKELFIQMIDMFQEVWDRSNKTYDLFKLNLLEYEEIFYQIIENSIVLKYDLFKAEIIIWYIFHRQDEEGNVLPLILNREGKEKEELILNTSTELWNLIDRLQSENLNK
jgi:hypothetical protein